LENNRNAGTDRIGHRRAARTIALAGAGGLHLPLFGQAGERPNSFRGRGIKSLPA